MKVTAQNLKEVAKKKEKERKQKADEQRVAADKAIALYLDSLNKRIQTKKILTDILNQIEEKNQQGMNQLIYNLGKKHYDREDLEGPDVPPLKRLQDTCHRYHSYWRGENCENGCCAEICFPLPAKINNGDICSKILADKLLEILKYREFKVKEIIDENCKTFMDDMVKDTSCSYQLALLIEW